MNAVNRQMTLRRYPEGMPRESDFEVVTSEIPDVGEGEVLCRAQYLTVDPYIRVHVSPSMSVGYAPTTPLGAPIPGEAILQVVQSRHPGFKDGDFVAGFGGWQDYCALPGDSLRKVDRGLAPLSAHLGSLGMPGLTAYVGMTKLAEAQAGQTVFVSAALGGVGAVAGQLARIKGCRVVGVTSSAEKCRYAVEELGYDACLDRTRPDFAASVAAACPEGIDVNFENAGGEVFWAAFNNMKPYGRVLICGLVADYNDGAPPPGPDQAPHLLRMIALKRLVLKGVMVADYWDLRPRFLEEVSGLIRDGRLKSKEYVVQGIENAGRAMIDMLSGRNFGKTVVRIADAPVD
ncbi:NADP-dependent oxidoreductase [Phenylobacterium sp.]|uniref:NADP-dependent oxidoreductase n=1 Tax=Phenylobacterium sp. TaxID=1871053 RepID=UPI00286B5331|nr:NADP-dependent oxidoreductase [Phenylobacterium sp.]